jgi:two-component system sensor histidine kinase CpxA
MTRRRRVRVSLFTKTLLWFFLNLVVLVAVLLAVFNLQFRFSPESPLVGRSGNRLEFVAGLISDEIRGASRETRAAVLTRYSTTYQVGFRLYDDSGQSLAGDVAALPDDVLRRIVLRGPAPAPAPPPPPPPPPPESAGPRPRPRPEPSFMLRTSNPTRYWAGVRLLVFEPDRPEPMRATLVAESDSISGHGLFFDPRPWLVVVGVVVALSVLLWLPFVRSLTVSIRQMTAAAEHIADERFDTRVDERRSDELGRLGGAVNQLAARLEQFVGGQKRFLGDVSHELNSPLARLQVALGILDERVDPDARGYVADAQEDVRLMAELIGQLLAFAKAGLKPGTVTLTRVPLRPLVAQAIAREAPDGDVVIRMDDEIAVRGDPELLARAVANVVRNAARYAAGTGVAIAAERRRGRVSLTIADGGPGVPLEALDRLFDPFFRLESDRDRATGGSGLGLAIVKASVEACGGTVGARNLSPHGLAITIELEAA